MIEENYDYENVKTLVDILEKKRYLLNGDELIKDYDVVTLDQFSELKDTDKKKNPHARLGLKQMNFENYLSVTDD